jgi:hypothetical protein
MSQTRRKSSRSKGGRRKSRRSGAGSWPQFVKKTYQDMKRSNKNATFKDAMKRASELKKKGQFP